MAVSARRLGVGAALALMLAGCAALRGGLQRPAVSLASIRIAEIGMLEQRFALRLRVRNTASVALPVTGLSYTLAVDGSELGRGASPRAFTVPAYDEQTIELDLTTNALGLLGKLRQWSERPPKDLDYVLSGELKLENFRRPLAFERTGSVSLAGNAR